MAVIKIKASVEKKDEKLKNVRDIIKTLRRVYADEKLLTSFKDKFQDWTNKVIKEWLSCNAEKSDEFQNSKLFRVLSTTFISVCFLEFFRSCLTKAPNMSYMTLTAVYYLLLVVMDLASVVLITYLRSPSIFFYQIYEYFEMVLCMYRLLNHRINYVQRRMNLNVNRQNNLPPDIYAFEENSRAKFSYSLFSLYSFYGIYVALCIFISFCYFHCESLTVLNYLTFNLLFLVASSKVFVILKFLKKTMNRRKNVQALTDEFKTWFDSECELKRTVQESRENTKIFSAFSHRSSKTFPADEYLNFLIFAVTCEGIFRPNFNDQDLEKVVLVLLYGQFSILKEDSQSNQFIQITTSFNSCNELIKSTKFLDGNAITADDERNPKNKIKTNKIVKPTDSLPARENITKDGANLVTEAFKNKKGKSQIPRLPLSFKAKVPPVPTSNFTLQSTSCDENLSNPNDLPYKQNADLVNHSNSRGDEEHDEADLIRFPVTPSNSASNTSMNATVQPSFYDENLVYQNGPSTKENVELVIHSNTPCEEKNGKANFVRTPVTPLISESNAVTKTTHHASFPDENLEDKNDLAAEQEADPAIHSNSRMEEKDAEIDLIGTSVTPLISESLTKTTQQASFSDENLEDQNGLSFEQEAYPGIHSNLCSEEKNSGVDLNVIFGNEETDSTPMLLLAVDTSGNCYKGDSKTDVINKIDLNTRKENQFNFNNGNIESDIDCYNESEIIPTAQNSNAISSKSEPSTNSVTYSMDVTKPEVKTSNIILDESSGDKVEDVTRPLLSNKKNLIDGYNDDVDVSINSRSNPDADGEKCIDKGNENNQLNLQESEEIGTILRNEIPNKNLEITNNNEPKLVTSQNDRMKSFNSLDLNENETDDFKRPKTGKEGNLSSREELSSAQEIYSYNIDETMRELLERISDKNFYINMNGYLTSNSLSDFERLTVNNFISACKNYLGNEVVESTCDPKSNPNNDVDNDLSKDFSKLNIQSGYTPSIASNENIPKLNSNENFHGYKIKGVFHIEDTLMESSKIAVLDKAFTSSSPQTENTPQLKSSVSTDAEQKINPNCSEQNISNNDVEQYGVAYGGQISFSTHDVKELNENSSNSLVLMKVGEKHTADNMNNEPSENLPHIESTRNHMRNESKPDETFCIASCGNSEINKWEDSSSKCTENFPVLAEDALNHNGSEPKLPTENLCQRTNIRTETFDEIKAKPEETWSTTPEINEHELPADITTPPHSISPPTRVILKGKRRNKKACKRRQGNKKEGGVNLGDLQESENINRIETESSILRASEQETSTYKSETFTTNTWENFTNNIRENFANFAWKNFPNRNNEYETTNECVPSGEISTSQVHNESETETPVNSVNLNGMARINNKNAESMKTSAQNDNANVVLSMGDLDGNDPNKLLATEPAVSILSSKKSEESISQVTNSVSQNEVDTNVSIFKSSQEDSSINRESKEMSDDLISAMKTRSQASIPPIVNETQKNTSKEKICQEQTTENSEKGESNQKDQIKGERDNSRDSYADEQSEFYKDISAVRNVNANCDSTASSSDLNRETYTSLNERKILMADSSQMCQDLEENNELDNSSLDVTPHGSKGVFQNTICEQDQIFIDGSKKNICSATSSLTNTDNSKNCNKSASRIYIKRKGQTKIRYTDDSAAVNDETGKQNVNSEEYSDNKRNTEVTRKKDKRYICLQKFRGIIVDKDSNTERCEIQRYESQASYVSSSEKLSMTQETTSLKMDRRNRHSENGRKTSSNEFSNNTGFEQESGAKNKDITKWISSISSPDESSTLSERLPTGSSEDDHFHLHPSTSVSHSNTSKNAKEFSNFSTNSQVCASLPEEEQPIYDRENFYSGCHLTNMPNTVNEKGKGAIKWKSNLSCHNSEASCKEHKKVKEGRSVNESLDLERESTPLKYHLKCDNLEIRFLDSQPNLTLRFVKESENESHPVPKNRKFIETLIHSDSTDEILLPTDTSSLHDGHFSPTHPSEIPKISNIGDTVQMLAERLPASLIGNTDHQNASSRKLSSPNPGHNDIHPSEDSESQQKATLASTDNDSKIKPDANVCALNPELKNSEKPDDFIFESEIMKINYKPYSNSESISISYRRHRNDSKLTFKSQEKKLYLKTSKSRDEAYFE